MIIVEFFGGPGSGKTTTAASLWSSFKQQPIGGIEFCREYAQDVIFEGRKHMLGKQMHVVDGQYWKYKRLEDAGSKLVFSDSSLLLAEIYAPDQPLVAELAKELDAEFEIIRVFVRRVKPFQEFGRVQTEEQSRALDHEIRLLTEYDFVVAGDAEGIDEAFVRLHKDRRIQELFGGKL